MQQKTTFLHCDADSERHEMLLSLKVYNMMTMGICLQWYMLQRDSCCHNTCWNWQMWLQVWQTAIT